jgi:phage terminase large subunit
VTTKRIKLPPKLLPVFAPPRGSVDYRGAYGGRGSGKSFTFAKMAAIWGAIEPLKILCTRELQDSIKNSFHAELKNAIASDAWLSSCYDVGIDYLRGHNGTEFIFKGLRHNIQSIKSLAQIDLCIIEEAEDVPEYALIDLEPTIRAFNSEIWLIWNPKKKGSPVDKRFRQNPPKRCLIAELNYKDNPWFPQKLENQRVRAQETMDDYMYRHIWEGAYLEISDAQIFKGKFKVKEFESGYGWSKHYGLDFGFSQDPTAGVCVAIFEDDLYIEFEAGQVGLELDQTSDFLIKNIPGISANKIRADNARPESISYLKRNGLRRIEGAKKGPGSVVDGIEHMKSFGTIYIHPRCVHTIEEFVEYSYKIDRLSGDVLGDIVDKYNHYIDAIRYALEGVKKNLNYGDLL